MPSYLRMEPMYAPLRNEPGFIDLTSRVDQVAAEMRSNAERDGLYEELRRLAASIRARRSVNGESAGT